MIKRLVWGLDIGGTKSALVIGDEQGQVLQRWQVDTATYPQWEALLDTLIKQAEASGTKPAAIGVSCGGPLDAGKGLILSPPNLPGWDNVPITAWLRQRAGVPAYLQNDANACALAEWMFGAGRGCRHMIFLTFGTGMGAGLILDGRLYEGADGMAGEVGHIRLAEDGPEGYGKRGSFEGFCSGGGLNQLANMHLGRDLSAKDLSVLADAGDADAARVLSLSARYLGRGLAMLIDLFNPERIVIGSIFTRAEKWFRQGMLEEIKKEALAISRKTAAIVPAQLGDSIGDAAALTTAWNGLKEDNTP